MAQAGVNTDVVEQLTRIGQDIDPAKVTARFLKVAAQTMKSDVQENFQKASSPNLQRWAKLAHPRPFGGTKPLNNFGLLRASFVSGPNHIERTDQTSTTIGSNRPGANLMHFGGKVVPVNAKALAIPITKEAARLRSPRQFPRKLFMIWKPGRKSGVLAETGKTGQGRNKKAKLIVHYVLTKWVVIPARPIVGFGDRLVNKLSRAWQLVLQSFFATGKPPAGGNP